MDDYYHEINTDSQLLEFSKVRMLAEDRARELASTHHPSWQDTNLDEIYNYIAQEYMIQQIL